jgi:hypothetical protein
MVRFLGGQHARCQAPARAAKKIGAGHKDIDYAVCGVLDFARPFLHNKQGKTSIGTSG